MLVSRDSPTSPIYLALGALWLRAPAVYVPSHKDQSHSSELIPQLVAYTHTPAYKHLTNQNVC